MFEGETVAETLAGVIKDPDRARRVAGGHAGRHPAAAEAVPERDVRRRLQSMGEARVAVEDAIGGLDEVRCSWNRPGTAAAAAVVPIALAAVAALVAAGVTWALRPDSPAQTVGRFVERLPDGVTFSNPARQILAISRDGTQVAFTANNRIYVRRINELGARSLTGDPQAGIMSPVFSPDGAWIAFFSPVDRSPSSTRRMALMRVPAGGGTGSPMAAVEAPLGATWGVGGILIGQGDGIVRVPATGGSPELIVRVGADEQAYRPEMLPDGNTVLFTRAKRESDNRWDQAEILAHSLRDGSRKVVLKGASHARYLPSGHLTYARAGTLFAVAFDVQRLVVIGSPIPVVVGVGRSPGGVTGVAHFDVSDTGVLAYRPGQASTSSEQYGLAVGSDAGVPQLLPIPAGRYSHPRASPDGRLVAVARLEGDQRDVWLYDLGGKIGIRRLTFGGNSQFPVWSSDGRRVTFQSSRDGAPAIFWQAHDGSGTAERLTTAAAGEEHVPEAWSPDGAHLLFSVRKGVKSSLWVLTLDGRKTEPFGQVQSFEGLSASFSPDGRWVAYASTAVAGGGLSSDRGVFVEPFPATGEKHQAPKVLIDFHPVWAPNGRSLFYIASSARPMISVPISTQPSVTFGTPVELGRAPNPGVISIDVRGYDVLRDGRIVALARQTLPDSVPTEELRFVLNWFEELTRLAPRDP